MSSRVPDRHRLRIKNLNPIESVVSEYLQLSKSGPVTQDGVCPFHEEGRPRPNLRVHLAHNSFHCFGCRCGGDVFIFVSTIEQTTYDEAVLRLAARVKYTWT